MATRALRLSPLAPNCTGLDPPAIGRLSEVRVPALIVLGDKDTSDIHAIGELIHQGIQGSRVERIPVLSLPHTSTTDLPGIRQALAATRHLLEMYRRGLPDEKTRRRLQRLDRRLLDVAVQLDRFTTAQK